MCKKTDNVNNSEELVFPVTVTFPEKGDIEVKVVLTGKVEGYKDVYVFSRVPGYYLKSLKKEGSFVKKGEIIALFERKEFGLEFEPLKIEAPVSGRISYFSFDKGEFITPQKPIARIFDDSKYKVLLSLPSKYLKYLRLGQKVDVIVERDTFKGYIGKIYSVSSPFTGNFNFEVYFENKDKFIVVGSLCEVKFVLMRKKNVLRLRKGCLVGGAKKSVFVVKGGIARRRPVITGLESENWVEIIDGLTDKDSVILKGAHVVKDGFKVKVVKGG
jgi:multidrug efflux pump subunit AcrA (membrane-fusion protein)